VRLGVSHSELPAWTSQNARVQHEMIIKSRHVEYTLMFRVYSPVHETLIPVRHFSQLQKLLELVSFPDDEPQADKRHRLKLL